MRHPPTNLYIDTQVFVQNNLNLNSGDFRKLKDTFVKDGLRLLVPEMMERELFRKYEERAKKVAKKLEDAHNIYPVNSLSLGNLPSRGDLEKKCLDELKLQWEIFKEHFVVEKLPLVGNLEDVVDWYFGIKAPFSTKKSKEFPDAFILSALEWYHQEKKVSIAVITADNSFAEACLSRRYIDHYSELNKYIDAFKPITTESDLETEPIDLTQPIATEDLTALKEIVGRDNNVTSIEIDRALKLIQSRGENYRYFFLNSSTPIWLSYLKQKDYFKSPPAIRYLPNGYMQYPSWPELEYLKNVSQEAPEKVINIVLELPTVDNPRVYNDILEIALLLNGEQSARLKPKMLEYARLEHQFLAHGYHELVVHWVVENQIQAALELVEILVQFRPDPKAEEKAKERRENSHSLIMLDPSPKLESWDYQELLNKGVRPLADKDLVQVARILIDATASMIRLSKGKDELESGTSQDELEVSCPKLNEHSQDHQDPRKDLVHTLVYACEKVYEHSPESIVVIDNTLRNQRWNIFKRIRQHLYALHPSELTKPWIQEFILSHSDYNKHKHDYEFQRMIKVSCEHFGRELLTENERTQIFDAILSGPPAEDYRSFLESIGEEFTESYFNDRKRDFHRLQLRPFATQLSGKYETYFEELNKEEEEITDENYLLFQTSGVRDVTFRSPRSSGELSKLSDEELLDYINEWQDEYIDPDDWIEIRISALAEAFQAVFAESIISEDDRLTFWIEENRQRIERPIYVQSIIQAMHEQVKDKNFTQLSRWFDFCEWVVSHSDVDPQEHHNELSLENPSWLSAKRTVCEFVRICIEKEGDVPISHRKQLAKLLDELCTQLDWGLDRDKPILSHSDPITTAINTTRGRALEGLAKFGQWVRRHGDEGEISEVTSIIEKRFKPEAEYPLTTPEYAILGMYYIQIYSFNRKWSVKHKPNFLSRDNMDAWKAAFSSFLIYNRPHQPIFDVIRDEFEFALEHLEHLDQPEGARRKASAVLGEHLFLYYLWEVYPLTGDGSLLERFYQKSDNARKHWATLFDSVGRLLENTNEQHFNENLKNRTIAFFEWRLEAEESVELREFTFWLKAECLEAEWRLEAYSKTLDVPNILDTDQNGREASIYPFFRSLHKMLPEHTSQVVECFAKLIHAIPQERSIHLSTDEGRAILKAGFNHNDESVCQRAEETREDLLRRGYLSFLDLDA